MNSAIKYIFSLPWDAHVTAYYRELQWLKVRERMQLSVGSLAYKSVTIGAPSYIYEFFSTFAKVSDRVTRNTGKTFKLPKNRTKTLNSGFACQAVTILNTYLKYNNNEQLEVKKFNKLLKENLLNKYGDGA